MKRKLDETQVKEIMILVKEGLSDIEIAKQFGVTRPVIGYLRRGITYRKEQKKTGPKVRSVEERFWSHVIKSDDPNDCWGWDGASRNKTSYGTISKDGISEAAYRISFEIHYRPIVEDEWVLHSCDNVLCTNPKHLYIGDRLEWAKKWHRKDEMTFDEYEIRQQKMRDRVHVYYENNRDKRRKYTAEYQLKKKIEAIEILGGKCETCEESHPAALQFHHCDPRLKSFAINSKTLSYPSKYPWDKILIEIAKCDLLCGNCHSKRHSSWTQDMIDSLKDNG